MDKSNWPKSWKAQYNSVINRRRALSVVKTKREEIIEEITFPQIWKKEISEEAIFSFVGYNFRLERNLAKLIQSYVAPDTKELLRLSENYLNRTDSVFPGYYSDRERVIVILNRFRESKSIDGLCKWIEFSSSEGNQGYNHFLLGVLNLNEFLVSLCEGNLLSNAIIHLSRARDGFQEERSLEAIRAVLAFAHYMNNDFNKSLKILTPLRENPLEKNFYELIKNSA